MKIIALFGIGNSHKTTSIKLFFDQYVNLKNGFTNINDMSEAGRKDIIITAIYNEKIKVGIASQGDSRWFLEKEFEVLKDCEIVICACRTKGNGPSFLKEKATETNGGIIWIEKGRITTFNGENYGSFLCQLQDQSINNAIDLIYNAFKGIVSQRL
ncbi:MAG: hypothetical protein IJT04_02960 [Bacteroidales bacterium]|nr:hypothetical protein [Clostridia bacterium]MBQ7550473.1 hypothetical protein [Bacteroidales bacterium]